MMISPDGLIDQHRDKKYKELLPVRDELISEKYNQEYVWGEEDEDE